IENQKNSLALVAQPFDYCRDGRLLLLVCADPAQPYAEADEIGTQSGLRLRPNPPRRPVVGAMALRIGGRERRLAHSPHPVQRRDSDAHLVALERRRDCSERVVTTHEVQGNADRNVRECGLAGKRRLRPGKPCRGFGLPGKNSTGRLCCRLEESLKAGPRFLLADAVKITALQMSKESRCLARFNEDREHKVGPISRSSP